MEIIPKAKNGKRGLAPHYPHRLPHSSYFWSLRVRDSAKQGAHDGELVDANYCLG